MPKTPDWQRPVELPAHTLTQTDSHQPTHRAAREIPLEQTETVADDPAETDTAPLPPQRPRRGARLFWLLLGGLVLLAIGAELYRLISWGLNIHTLLGAGLGLLTLLLVLLTALELKHSLKGSRQLRTLQQLQQQAEALQSHNTQGKSQALLHQLEQRYRDTPIGAELQTAIAQLDSSYNDAEIIHYLNRHALNEVDLAAQRCVKRYSIESGVMVALSPWASFDMLLMAWRNLRMVREIANLYGIAPGLLTHARLLKQILQSLAFAGASEVVMDAGSALLGSSLTSSLSARAGQGLGAGLFTARTGLTAIRLCRPLPRQETQKGLLSQISKGILSRLTGHKD